MDNRRGRGAAVASVAVVALLIGGGWWWRSASAEPPRPVPLPQPSPSPSWQAAVGELAALWADRPNSSVVAIQPPLELSSGQSATQPLKLPYGAFELHAVCVGDAGTMRVTVAAADGRTVSAVDAECSLEVGYPPEPLLLPKDVGQLQVTMSVDGTGGAVGAWRVLDKRAPGGPDQWRLQAQTELPADRAARTLYDSWLAGGDESTAELSLSGPTELRVVCAGEIMLRLEVEEEGNRYRVEHPCNSGYPYANPLGTAGTVRVTLTGLGPAGTAWVRVQAVRLPPGATPS
ncbi:DUF6023 family protein [Catellatospora citrea]|uniref:DUF6023 family protein n=1 Tax=Catellatospora citrea TaxID=53366 RepID=UPI0011C4900C|nr:DUF6023 family protein [Catellatospora citrea]